MQLLKQWKAFGGLLKQYAHESTATKCTMKFCIYLPPGASDLNKVPVLYFLAGLTCDEERMFIKAPNAMKAAASRGIAIVSPDTSPRGVSIEGQDEHWDFGSGAGFYLDAKEPKWKEHYNMYTYVTKELPSLINSNFPIAQDKQSIFGHSMGGHGALVIGIKNADKYRSISALSPIVHPTQCLWGIKAFTGYLGPDQESWKEYDATLQILEKGPIPQEILVDQGAGDSFLKEQLLPEALEAACGKVNQKLKLRMQEGYDHSYYFISSFIEEHVNFHADALLD